MVAPASGPGKAAVEIVADDSQVLDALNKLLKEGGDGRPAFKSISSDWYKWNRRLFRLKGPGKYEDLTEGYKKAKKKALGTRTPYPILRGKYRRIESGLTEQGSEYNVHEMNKTSLVMGVQNAEEAVYNQLGTIKMPARIFVFNSKHGGQEFQLQMTRWKQIYQDTLGRRINRIKGKGKI